ncbi:hypothetical protein Halxa_4221 [Halopiger xanaduensis SH-6]|uniref:Uncharacterized protein n=1 Tax=Halopiger xanaduensis (strain DSM 18323 / JCM 14033 / SH-6) TaxID=797210 RepID=F8D5I7_HALXS|nr:hypothetical protein Halxa_4221 [Halopiger xanaduensis SH-6]
MVTTNPDRITDLEELFHHKLAQQYVNPTGVRS